MRLRALFGVLIALLCLLGAAPALADKRVALVIGNSAYQHATKLANPANDAAAVTEMFRRAQFEVVESKRDLNNADMRRALREFSLKSRDADIAVIYYAGHGIEIDGQNYLLPVDAELARDTDAYDEAVSLDRVLQVIEPAKKLRLVILDACRDNPFARTMKRTVASRALGRGLAGVEPGKPNTLIAFAAKGGSTAEDGSGGNSPFTTALIKHLTTPGLDLRKAFGLIRDDVIKATGNRQEPFVYGSLGGSDVALVPLPAAAPQASVSQPAANPQAEIRRDYELSLQLNNRQAWEFFLQQYPSGFYANLARVQLEKIGAEEAQRSASDKAKQAEAERTRLATEKASAEEQAKAAREAKAAEVARLAAEKQRQSEQAKADAAERARAAAERAAADKLTKEKAEAEAKAIRETAQAEAKAIRDKAEADAKAAEKARKDAEKEAERLRVAALEQAKTAAPAANAVTSPAADKPADVAALPPEASKTTLSQTEINRALQAELRRVGCQAAAAGDDWSAAARRSLEQFNKHAKTKFDVKLASLDALDAVRGKQARICPLICEHGFRANGEKCEKIVCRAGYTVGDDNSCEKIEPRKPAAPVAKREAPAEPKPAAAASSSSGQIICTAGGCRPAAKGCRLQNVSGSAAFYGGGVIEVCR
jgi:uncharacterized caspase-like protein